MAPSCSHTDSCCSSARASPAIAELISTNDHVGEPFPVISCPAKDLWDGDLFPESCLRAQVCVSSSATVTLDPVLDEEA